MAGDAGDGDDLQLLRRAGRGDARSFEALVRRHEDRLFAIAYRLTGDREDALDAVQDALLTLYRRAGSFRAEASPSTWLYRITVNAAIDVLRKRAKAPRPEEIEERPAPGDVAGQVADRVALAAALAALDPPFREAVLLHDVAGLTHEAIAAATGSNVGTIKSRISRGRRRLAELLEPSPSHGPSKDR